MTPDFETSGKFVMHKSITVLETEVTRVGSLINSVGKTIYDKNVTDQK